MTRRVTTASSTEQHWEWVEGLINVIQEDRGDKTFLVGMSTLRYAYITAMEHGRKHGYDEAVREIVLEEKK